MKPYFERGKEDPSLPKHGLTYGHKWGTTSHLGRRIKHDRHKNEIAFQSRKRNRK